ERVTLCAPGIIERVLGDVRAWAQNTKLPDGRRVVDQEWVQEHLARIYAELEYLRLINWKVAWQATQGQLDVADASSIKVFGTEFYLRSFRSLMEILGQAGYLMKDSPAAPTRSSATSSPSSASACRGHAKPTERAHTMDFTFSEEQDAVRELAGR